MASGSPSPRFRDLGPLVVETDGLEASPTGRPALALALLLIHANRRVSADALREALWGEATGRRAASTLESHMFRLRRVVEPERAAGQAPSAVISEPGGYRLVVAPDRVDSLRFAALAADAAELLRSGQPERARRKSEEALALRRGRPFEPASDQEWAAAAVSRLEEVHAQLCETHVEALLGCGDPEGALRELGTVLAEHPLRERLWGQRMLAAFRCGRTDEALDAYQRIRRALLDELGVEPGRELRDLQARILADDEGLVGAPARPTPPPARSAPVDLPRRHGTLIGREEELGQVLALCSDHPVVTLVGAAGCGKTRLAVEAAAGAADEFVDGIWFVDLTAAARDAEVVDAVVSALGLAPAPAGSPTDAVRMAVRDRRMLLVLDNCEHVLDGVAELVDALHVPGAELSILATSREPLQVDPEVVLLLEPLATSGPGGPEDVPAVRLFLDRIAGPLPTEESRAEQLALVADICRSVDGVPLAVELAAGRTRAYGLAEIAAQVARDPAALRQLRRGPSRQETVRSAVQWSYRMLTATEQLVHRRTAVVPGPFTADAAARVAGVERADVDDVLVGLVHRSMLGALGPARPGGPSRFAQLTTIRAHGQHELAALHESEAAVRARDARVAELVGARPRLGHPDERRWFQALDDDLAAVRATLDHTLALTADPLGCRLVGNLTMFWYHRGLVPEGGRFFALARDVPTASPLERALVLVGLAGERALAQRMDVADPLIAEALRVGEDRTPDGDVRFGESLLELAGGVQLAGDLAGAADLARRALGIADRHDDERLALIARARLAMLPGDPAATASAPEIYAAAQEENHYAAHLAATAATLAAVARGDAATGLAWSDRILDLHRRHGVAQAPVVLEMRANLLTMAGDPLGAVRLYAAARAHNRRAGLPWPSRDITAALLARAADLVDRTRYEDAWRSGSGLTLTDLEPSTPPGAPAVVTLERS
ncbi:BTAD domain-containing putative transcriptional regulator [Actinomycetospora atypica]|uniref:BTAD domain-containing putative transcriptional regulator n=1 Tax=Actinomycetospora atypica TaxID=1290095 RepID=A0ABV9YK30_9PSEU